MEEKILLMNYGDYQAKWKPEYKRRWNQWKPEYKARLKELKSGWENYKTEWTEFK